ncbi:MAG: hypothetical protein V3R25_05705 [Nitrosomonadaceae bacterium]
MYGDNYLEAQTNPTHDGLTATAEVALETFRKLVVEFEGKLEKAVENMDFLGEDEIKYQQKEIREYMDQIFDGVKYEVAQYTTKVEDGYYD